MYSTITLFIVNLGASVLIWILNPVTSARTLQHPALLQCLAQCSEVTPYLLVMEFCPLVGYSCLFSLFQIPHYSLSFHAVCCLNYFQENISCLFSGWFEELPAQLPCSWVWDPKPFAPPANGVRHCFRASAPPQIRLYTQVQRLSRSQLYLHSSLLMSKKGRIHLCVLCSPCWSLPTTTSWCCLSEFQKLQHQWFCCGGWTPLALSLQCSGFQVKELPVCGGGELKQSDLFSQNTENRINWQVI